MKLKEFLVNRDFDVNAEYAIYYETWDDGGECLWISKEDGKISCDDLVSQYDVTYITINCDTREMIIEVASGGELI